MTSQIATRHSWKTVESPEQLTQLQYQDHFTQAEYETVAQGLIPQAMEDKWFIFYEDSMVYLHRSWTGELIYRITLERDNAGARVICAEVSPEYLPEPIHEKLLPWIIRDVLLRQNVEFPEI